MLVPFLRLSLSLSLFLSLQWMHALTKAGKPWEAISIFDNMLTYKYVTAVWYTCVPHHVPRNHFARVLLVTTVDCCGDVVTRVRRLQPDVFTLSNLLSACSRINDFERAKLYWRSLLRAQGTREGALRYLVAGGARSPRSLYIRNHGVCAVVFASLAPPPLSHGCAAVVPNEVCYNAYLHCASVACSLKDALDILDMMRAKGLKPNVGSYGAVINACSAAGKPHMAFTVRRGGRRQPPFVMCGDDASASFTAGSPRPRRQLSSTVASVAVCGSRCVQIKSARVVVWRWCRAL